MIDLRKPLEGVPGLLLLAALILFGAAIGISLALLFSLVDMKDSLANFLGGVVGAGLGAALAVMGAVYVQRQERRDRLSSTINEWIARLVGLRSFVVIFKVESENAPTTGIAATAAEEHLRKQASRLEELFGMLGAPYELSREAIARVDGIRLGGLVHAHNVVAAFDDGSSIEERKAFVTECLDRLIVMLDAALEHFRGL